MLKINLNTEFSRFVLTGGFAAGVNFLSRIGLSELMSYRFAVFVAYIIGMVTAFILSKIFVFQKSGQSTSNEFIRFSIVNIVAVIQVWLISVGLVEYGFPAINFNFHPEEVAHLIGISVPVITSYYGHKHFTFAEKSNLKGK